MDIGKILNTMDELDAKKKVLKKFQQKQCLPDAEILEILQDVLLTALTLIKEIGALKIKPLADLGQSTVKKIEQALEEAKDTSAKLWSQLSQSVCKTAGDIAEGASDIGQRIGEVFKGKEAEKDKLEDIEKIVTLTKVLEKMGLPEKEALAKASEIVMAIKNQD